MFTHVYRFVRRVSEGWVSHGNSSSAAAMAYYGLFALAPILVVATAIAGWFIGEEDAQALVQQRLSQAVGPAGAEVTAAVLEDARLSRHGMITTIISGLLTLYGASGVFAQLRTALDEIFGIEVRETREAVLRAIIGRILAALFVIGAGGVLMVMLVGGVFLHIAGDRLATWTGYDAAGWQMFVTTLSVVAVAGLLLATYRFLPSSHPSFRHVWVGVLVSTALLEGGRFVFGYYISRSVIASAYGPSTSLVALVIWTYFASQITLLGAEISAATYALNGSGESETNDGS